MEYKPTNDDFTFTGTNFHDLYAWSVGHAGARFDGKYCEQCYIDDMVKHKRHIINVGDIIQRDGLGFIVHKKQK